MLSFMMQWCPMINDDVEIDAAKSCVNVPTKSHFNVLLHGCFNGLTKMYNIFCLSVKSL